jgi:hypothetical protein
MGQGIQGYPLRNRAVAELEAPVRNSQIAVDLPDPAYLVVFATNAVQHGQPHRRFPTPR